ncbi:MAG: hypothetical protein KME64_06705 [Scytonematopsis contorta HA4267-MV1]|jgi:hypothetical protein|nr:hypothetical protein [Scytonematopsis contorta HA4267-MV1]
MLRRKDEYGRERAAGYKTLHDQNLSNFYWYSRNYSTPSDKDEIEEKLQRPSQIKDNDFKYIAKTLFIFASSLTFLSFLLCYQANSFFHSSKEFPKFSAQKVVQPENQ